MSVEVVRLPVVWGAGYATKVASCRNCGWLRERNSTYCSSCKRIAKREAKCKDKARRRAAGKLKGENHRQRARRYGVPYEPINIPGVFVRDGWQCGICHQPIDASVPYPQPMSPSLDHILPMVHGGGHTLDNVQASHFICNSTVGAKDS